MTTPLRFRRRGPALLVALLALAAPVAAQTNISGPVGSLPGTATTLSGRTYPVWAMVDGTTGNLISYNLDATDDTAINTKGPQVKCNASTAAPAAVGGDGRAKSQWCDLNGRVHVIADPPGALQKGAITTAMTSTTSTSVISAVASNYLYITSCAFSNDHASVSTLMKLQDGSGGTVLWMGIVPFGGGNNVTWPSSAPLKVPTLGNGLFVVNVTSGSSTYASCSGFASTVSY